MKLTSIGENAAPFISILFSCLYKVAIDYYIYETYI